MKINKISACMTFAITRVCFVGYNIEAQELHIIQTIDYINLISNYTR